MASIQRRMLSKDDEASAGTADLKVRREDQDRINTFSRLHQRRQTIDQSLKTNQKEKEDLEEVATELEFVDDEKVAYKIGDTFVLLPLEEVQELLTQSVSSKDSTISDLESRLEGISTEMNGLKAELYARFGKSINLET